MDAYWTPMVYKNQAPINNCSQEGRIQHAEWRTETPTIVDVVRHYGYYCVAELCIFYGSLTPIDNFNINFRQGWTHTHTSQLHSDFAGPKHQLAIIHMPAKNLWMVRLTGWKRTCCWAAPLQLHCPPNHCPAKKGYQTQSGLSQTKPWPGNI